MRRGKTIGQFLDVLYKILIAFIIVFVLYFIGNFIETFAYDYFIFPFLSIIIIFVCGVNVGKSLEKIKHNESTGIFTKDIKKDTNENITEFIIEDTREIITNKKILKELEDGDKVHVKTYQIHETYLDDENEIEDSKESEIE